MADVLIIGRGGGSFEDLNAFNDEKLARAIAACPIPVISAVGHETDYTICDFVSDKRAPTPSAAAELAAPGVDTLSDNLVSMENRMRTAILGKLDKQSDRVRVCAESRMLSSPMEALTEKEHMFLQKKEYFLTLTGKMIGEKENLLSMQAAKLDALNPLAVLGRGYTAVFDEENKVVCSASAVEEEQLLTLRFSDGNVEAKVLHVERKEEQYE